MSSTLQRLREEIRKILGIALFFSVAFCFIILSNKLLVSGSDIKTASFVRAIIGGLIVAKIFLIVDLLPFVDLFPGKPLIYNILWKTPIYVAASLVFRYIEPLIKSLVAGAGIAVSHHQAIQEFTKTAFWATELWIALLFAIFVTMRELTRALGKDKVRLLFFGR